MNILPILIVLTVVVVSFIAVFALTVERERRKYNRRYHSIIGVVNRSGLERRN